MSDLLKNRAQQIPKLEDAIGASALGRAITDTLYVSPDGDGSDGSTWAKAYTTIQSALGAASTDGDDCTLILISPHATNYDINTTGDPTWAGNYILKGSYRIWVPIKNEHASATSVFKFTGRVSLVDLAIFTTGTVNGVIITKSGFRIRHCGFNCEGLTGAAKAIHIDGSGGFIRGGIIEEVEIRGHVTYTTGIYLDNAKINLFRDVRIHKSLNGVQIVHVDSDYNSFSDIIIADCAIGLNLDAGNEQRFANVDFYGNTSNIDDEAGDHVYHNLIGAFKVTSEPDNFTGVTVATGDGADVWTAADVEVRAAATSTVPFRILGIIAECDATEKFRIRLTADGTTYFSDIMVEGAANAAKRESATFPSGTEFIFNKGTQIKASSKSESVGVDNAVLWLEIQEI